MPITEKTFEAFIKCATKSSLYFHDVVGVPSEFSQSQDYLREDYKQRCREQLCSAVRDGQWHDGMPDPQSLADRRYRLIFDYAVTLPEIHARLDALEGIRIASNGRNCPYIPIRFVPSESSRHATSFSLRSTLLLSRKYAARYRKSAESFM